MQDSLEFLHNLFIAHISEHFFSPKTNYRTFSNYFKMSSNFYAIFCTWSFSKGTSTSTQSIYCESLIIIVNNIERVQQTLVFYQIRLHMQWRFLRIPDKGRRYLCKSIYQHWTSCHGKRKLRLCILSHTFNSQYKNKQKNFGVISVSFRF